MTPRERNPFFSTGTLVVAAIAAVAVIAAWQVGRRSERRAAQALMERAARDATPPAVEPGAALEEAERSHRPAESSATFEMPVAPDAVAVTGEPAAATVPPTAEPFPPPEERPADTPARCLLLQASPSMTSAYGRSGEVVQLVVRAQNGCSTNFDYASFRAIAIGADGREAGSVVGRFPGGVPASGSAETLVAIPTKPNTALTYRAEVR